MAQFTSQRPLGFGDFSSSLELHRRVGAPKLGRSPVVNVVECSVLDGSKKIRSFSGESITCGSSGTAGGTRGSFVEVYVWVSLIRVLSPGHAAMAIFPNATEPANGYISFAPLKQGSISGAGKFYSRAYDEHHYGTPKKKETERRGVWIGRIYGLNVTAMSDLLQKEIASPPRYSLANECATTVRRFLQTGGGDVFASWWSRNVFGFWSPDDVEDYARSIVTNTAHLGSTSEKFVGLGTV